MNNLPSSTSNPLPLQWQQLPVWYVFRIYWVQVSHMPRVSKDTPSITLGFKGDFFSEILHNLRGEPQYTDYVNMNMRLINCNDMRDKKAITRLASAYLKLIFPDLQVTQEEFNKYCVQPAVDLRQRVRDELHKMDSEYAKVSIQVEM